MHAASQRVDIAQQVEEFVEEHLAGEPEGMLEAIQRPRPISDLPATPMEPVPGREPAAEVPVGETWYVVVDEIVEDTVTFEAWPWPSVNPSTRFLSFDLDKLRRKTEDRERLQQVVDRLRSEQDMSTAATRPLRIGDVFQVVATRIKNIDRWEAVVDDTRRKRKAAQAALHAMAAPPHFGTSEELETVAKRIQDAVTPPGSRPDRAFPAV